MGGRSPAELPGAGERGDTGSLQGMRDGERFYSQGWRPSQVFPYKEESVGYSSGWCPRAPCWYLLGPGCRGSVPGSLASLWNLSVGIFLRHTSTCPTFQLLLFLMMGTCLCHRGLIVSYLVSVESFFDLIFLQCLETSFICTTLPGFPSVTESMELITQPLGKC